MKVLISRESAELSPFEMNPVATERGSLLLRHTVRWANNHSFSDKTIGNRLFL